MTMPVLIPKELEGVRVVLPGGNSVALGNLRPPQVSTGQGIDEREPIDYLHHVADDLGSALKAAGGGVGAGASSLGYGLGNSADKISTGLSASMIGVGAEAAGIGVLSGSAGLVILAGIAYLALRRR